MRCSAPSIATFTVTPVLSSILLPERVNEVETFLVRHIRRVYQLVLPLAVRRYCVSALIGLGFLAVCGLLGLRLGTEFLPKLEEGNMWIRAVMPPTITLEAGMETRRAHPQHHQELRAGRDRVLRAGPRRGRHRSRRLVPRRILRAAEAAREWPKGLTKEELVKQMSEQLKREFVGIDFNFSQYIQDNIEEAVSGVKGENSVKIFGRDLAELERLSKAVQDRDRQGAGRDRPRRLQPARPAQSGGPDRPRQGGALRLLGRRHQLRRAGGDRRPGGDPRLRGRDEFRAHRPAGAANIATMSTPSARSRSRCRTAIPSRRPPISRSATSAR